LPRRELKRLRWVSAEILEDCGGRRKYPYLVPYMDILDRSRWCDFYLVDHRYARKLKRKRRRRMREIIRVSQRRHQALRQSVAQRAREVLNELLDGEMLKNLP
jgi:hypothetical protein